MSWPHLLILGCAAIVLAVVWPAFATFARRSVRPGADPESDSVLWTLRVTSRVLFGALGIFLLILSAVKAS